MGTFTRPCNFSNRFKTTQEQNGSVATLYDSRYTKFGTNTRTGISLARYREIIKNGSNATTAMSGEFQKVVSSEPLHARVTLNVGTVQAPVYRTVLSEGLESGLIPFPLGPISKANLTKADNIALRRAYNAVQSQHQHFSGMTFLGELRETIQMFRRPYQGIVRGISSYLDRAYDLARYYRGFRTSRGRYRDRNARRGRYDRHTTQFLRDLSAAWLETSFGLLPLISDVKEAAETVARFQNDSVRTRFSASGEDTGVMLDVFDNNGLSGNSYFRLKTRLKQQEDISVRYLIGFEAKAYANFGSAARLAELSGFRPDQFIPTLWELCPWSWLVDYVTNLGDVINTSCMSQSGVKWVCRTERTLVRATFCGTPEINLDLIRNTTAGLASFSTGDASYEGEYRKVLRSSYNKLPNMTFQFEVPTSPVRYANVLAVWMQKQRQFPRV